MIARFARVGEPRWSPSGESLAWLDSWDGRTDVVVASANGQRPPRVVTADFAVTPAGAYGGGGYCWISDAELAVAGANGRLAIVSAEGGVVRVISTEGEALAPAGQPRRGDDRLLPRARRHLRHRGRAGRRVGMAAAHLARRTTRGTRLGAPTAAPSPGSNGISTRCPWDASRIAMRALAGPRAQDRRRRSRRGGSASPASRPTAPVSRGPAIGGGAINLWIARADGTRAKQLVVETDDHAEPAWAGQRSYAWSPDGTEIGVVPQRARLRSPGGAGRRRPRQASRAREGVAPRSRVVGRRHHRRALGRAHTLDDRRHRPRHRCPPGDRARPRGRVRSGGIRTAGPGRARGRHLEIGAGHRARAALSPGRERARPRHRSAAVRAHPRRADEPDPRGVEPRIRVWVSRGWAVLAPNYRGSPGMAANTRRVCAAKWGVVERRRHRRGESGTRSARDGATPNGSPSSAAARAE